MSNPHFDIESLMAAAQSKKPDIDLATDLAMLATQNARESIHLVASRLDHPMDISLVIMVVAMELYHHSRRNVEKMAEDAMPRLVWEGMDEVYRAATEEDAHIAGREFARCLKERRNDKG